MTTRRKIKRTSYYQVIDGEWIEVVKNGHRDMCCDCSLVHVVDYRINDRGKLEIRVRRDERATAAARRPYKFVGDE